VAFLSLPGLIVWVVFVTTFMRNRIRIEEEMLIEQFQGNYVGYRRNTWRMFPYLY
jgi:protein-S-isoprenylcysteine O-methyltransferase Ste14